MDRTTQHSRGKYGARSPVVVLSLMIILDIYFANIDAISGHIMHVNLSTIFYTHAEHSPTKAIYIKILIEVERKKERKKERTTTTK